MILIGGMLALAGCSQDGGEAPSPQQPPAQGRAEDGTESGPAPTLDDPAAGLELVAEDHLTAPLAMAQPEDGTGRQFIVDQVGLVWVLTADGEVLDEPFLDIRDRIVDLNEGYDERGLLGLAFHPGYAENGRFFVRYSGLLRPESPDVFDHTSYLSEFTVSDPSANQADPLSEQVFMAVAHPQPNHNGGTVAFGPDGYLYYSLGDGGAAGDVGVGHPVMGNGQDNGTILGSILRIDVDSGDPYAIPPDNPFVDGAGADEIYAYGFRNPYRFSFDLEGENQLFVGDVGQRLFEEVDIVEKGGNYGWRIMEATHCFDVDDAGTGAEDCPEVGRDGRPLLPPIVEYSHDEVGLAVVGGYVYRGTALPELDGVYVFGDYTSSAAAPAGSVLAAVPPTSGDGLWPFEEIRLAGRPDGDLGHYLLGFGQDLEGELYVLVNDTGGPSGDTGKVFQLVPPDQAAGDAAEESPSGAASAQNGATGEATPTTADGSAPMRTIEVIMTSFDLMSPAVPGDQEPMTVTIDEAGTYTFQAVNQSDIVHALEVEGQGVEAATGNVQPGQTAELTVTLEPGTYDLYCPVGNHKQQGMDGSVEVAGG